MSHFSNFSKNDRATFDLLNFKTENNEKVSYLG